LALVGVCYFKVMEIDNLLLIDNNESNRELTKRVRAEPAMHRAINSRILLHCETKVTLI
jgi:hypothetical protein